MTAVSLISYIDRNTLALLAPTILAATGISGEQYGWIISSFSIAYMAGNPLWGRWLDRSGVRLGMMAAVAFWSVASSSHALLSSFAGFALARAALGFGEGATFPGGLRTVVLSLPEKLRARGVAVAYSGGSLGAVLTPLIVTPVFNAFGWRAAFWFTGLIGVFWLGVWWFVSKSRPELRKPLHHDHAHLPLPWRDARLWAFMANYALGCLPLAFVLYQMPLYLAREFGKKQSDLGWVLWIPPLGWEVGYFFWGWMLDRGVPVRRLVLVAAIGTLPLAAGAAVRSFPVLLMLLFWTMFVAGGNVIVSLGFATRTFGSNHAGLLAGLGAGSWAAVVALTSPLFGRLVDASAWDAAFMNATAIPLLGFALWFLLSNGPRSEAAR
jgi:ACS family hexuronate transporter-like MFS transporter